MKYALLFVALSLTPIWGKHVSKKSGTLIPRPIVAPIMDGSVYADSIPSTLEEVSKGIAVSYIPTSFQGYLMTGNRTHLRSVRKIRVWELVRPVMDENIVAAIGEPYTVSIAEFWSILWKQGHGQGLDLLAIDGTWNIFFIPDDGGHVWRVRLSWEQKVVGSGWNFDIESPRHNYVRKPGERIIAPLPY